MLPAEIVSQVRRIQLTTGRQVADVLAGAYVSVFKGRGVEFDEVRPYVPGDDVRTIDWNVTARVGAPYVKRYVEERQLTVMLLVDMSASLDFGSAHRSKREAAVELSALLAFSAIHNDDKVGLLLFHAGVDEYIPPRKGQKHALRVVREVLARGREESFEARTGRQEPSAGEREGLAPSMEQIRPLLPGGQRRLAAGRIRGANSRGDREAVASRMNESLARLPRHVAARFGQLLARTGRGTRRATDIAAALEFCRRVLPRRAILFLVSDFIDEDYLDVLSNANRKHDVVAVRVADPRESAIESGGLVTLEDAETGARRLVDTGSAAFREAILAESQERRESLEQALGRVGIDLITVDAAQSVVDPLLRFFRMRQKRNRR